MTSYVVCGSRDWPKDKLWFVTAKMIELLGDRDEDPLVITGGAHGVDQHAHREAIRLHWPTKVVEADWERHGKRAGFLRNLAMLDEKPAAVLAFQWGRSKGTAHTIREAYKRGIRLHHFTEQNLVPDVTALDSDYEPITYPFARWGIES